MSSHNSAIASRTSCGEFTVTIHRYISVGRLCCTRSLILNNASPCSLCMIIQHGPEVGSVSQSLFFLPFASRDSPVALPAAFPCSLSLMLCVPIDFFEICLCAYQYYITSNSFVINILGHN